MIDRREIILGFQFILGRDPSLDELAQHEGCDSINQLRAFLFESDEFYSGFLGPVDALSIKSYGDPSGSLLACAVNEAFVRALALESKLPAEVLSITGMSGRKYRRFINNLIGLIHDPRYLEIGSWLGSTVGAAVYGNRCTATCIDNWSTVGSSKDRLLDNIKGCLSNEVTFTLLETDFRNVNFGDLGRHNVYFFDGPHKAIDQFDGVSVAFDALDSEYVFIVDDWNWLATREGTRVGLSVNKLDITYAIEIMTNQENNHPAVPMGTNDWHNGYCIMVVRRC